MLDSGIEAVTVVGGQIRMKAKSEFTNHACLLYKNSDGSYTFNDYGKSATIEASNIKDAIYTVHKETGLLESGGQITIHDKTNGSYQEFALSESSAYGRIIDKRDYNKISPVDNPVADNSSINATANVSSIGNVSASASATFANATDKGAISTTVGVEYKKSGENAEFYNSTSIGVMADLAQVRQVSDNTNLTYNIRGVYSHTTGELGGASYTDNSGETTHKSGGNISYETLMLRGSIGAETTIADNGNTQISNIAGVSIQGYSVLGHSNHYSSSYDGRITLEDGVKLNSGSFSGDVSGGLVLDTQQDNNGWKPTIGAKLNAGANYTFKPNDNLSINTGAKGYSVFTKSSTDTGLQATISANWTNPNSNSKIGSVWGSVGTNIENQNDVKAYKSFGRYGKYVVGHVPQEKTAAQATSEAIKNIQNTLKGSRRAGNLLMGVTFGFAVLTVITALNAHIGKKPIHYVKDENNATPKPQETAQPTELENTYRNAFTGLGVSEDTELKEYTPQKGEYWISILKAKYGVDDVTAQKMANKIKEMIYDDPKASKQTPIMYLPQTWTFEGKTYQYNDNAQADKTENYSDDVKTEMGKMSKDLKYNK